MKPKRKTRIVIKRKVFVKHKDPAEKELREIKVQGLIRNGWMAYDSKKGNVFLRKSFRP